MFQFLVTRLRLPDEIEAYFFIKTGCVILGGDTVIKVPHQNLTEVFIDGLQQSRHQLCLPDGSYSIPETDKENDFKTSMMDQMNRY